VEQQPLWHEDVYEALRSVVDACGGPKKLAAALWPSKPLSQARQRLLHCLDPERGEALHPHEVVWLLKLAREAGCHVAMHHIATECGYGEPVPTDPEDERAELQRRFLAGVDELGRLVAQMDRTAGPVRAVR